MNYRFDADFSFYDERGKSYNILIEQNSDLDHLHSAVKENKYHILVCGNKHFAHTPPLKNYRVKLALGVSPARNNEFGFAIFFRYDRMCRTGYALRCSVSNNKLGLDLLSVRNRNQNVVKRIETPAPARFDHSAFEVSMEVEEDKIVFALNDTGVEIADAGRLFQVSGSIGLDKTDYRGELIIKKFQIVSTDKLKKSRVIAPLTCRIPCVHGMSVPYTYTLNMMRYEKSGHYELNIKLSGGIKERPDRGRCGGQWCHEMDRMTNPYVRLDSLAGECRNIILRRGALTLLDREEKRPWIPDLYEDIPWPLEKTVCFDALPNPRDIVFAVGYEYFESDPKQLLGGGPFEVVCDSRGRVLYQGSSLRRGSIALSVQSPEDKLLCSRIPEGIPDRERALSHARRNHYFFEKEKIRFSINIHCQADLFFPEEFKLSARIQSVYGDSVGKEIRLSAMEKEKMPESPLKEKLGITCLRWNAEMDGTLGTGVYHLAIKLLAGNQLFYDDMVLFEVMSELPGAVPPPIASGLPLLFSDTTETKYLQTDAFDPLRETAGFGHYYSMCYFFPDYARNKQIWKLTKVYNRKWFLSITERTTGGDLSIEKNADIIKHCDFLQIPFDGTETQRYDLWKFDTYRNEVLDILTDFLRLNPEKRERLKVLSPALVEKIKTEKKYLPEEALKELVEHCWKEWLEYFSLRLAEVFKIQRDKLKKINRRVGRAAGGPFPLYASHNKSAYFMSYFGHSKRGGTEKYCDGFWQFEDYPYSCAYSNTRAMFPLMTLKLHYGSWRLFPEIYASLWDGCNDGAVSQAHPPYGLYDLPAGTIESRIYEYAFAVVWFKEKRFHFWNDYGFHFNARHKREGFAELVNAWGNVLKHKPVRPVKTTCFLHDLNLIAEHPDYYEKNCNAHTPWKDVFNTAEEALAYSYNAVRDAGLPGGFATSLNDLKSLSPETTDLLVIPPLPKGMKREHLETIRALHRQGVNLLGFETVPGLEDLFGVGLREEAVPIRKIGWAPEYASRIGGPAVECVEHALCQSWYESDGSACILSGSATTDSEMSIPVLVTKETSWGKTAFFNLPPTVVNRDSFVERVGYGQECVSAIIKESARYLIRSLSKPGISTPGAKVIAFHDERGDLIIVVEDDSPVYSDVNRYPRPVLLNIRRPGIESRDIICDGDYSVARRESGHIVVRLFLKKYEAVLFTFKEVAV
ncbi:MAG: hypothetical protein V2A65_08685 [Candidatus Omnitrophota bacterium]